MSIDQGLAKRWPSNKKQDWEKFYSIELSPTVRNTPSIFKKQFMIYDYDVLFSTIFRYELI